MTIITDHTLHTEVHQHEHELAARLEERRNIAERGAATVGGRLAFAAHLARRARAAHAG
ncbi:MAG: hypothetical protein ACR2FE_11800 [Aeromicrobium sp.]